MLSLLLSSRHSHDLPRTGYYYLVGCNKAREEWRILKLSRLDPWNLDVFEDSVTYSERECAELLGQLHSGNVRHGGLKLVLQACTVLPAAAACACEIADKGTSVQANALLGCYRFLGGYYLLFATRKRLAGNVCGEDSRLC